MKINLRVASTVAVFAGMALLAACDKSTQDEQMIITSQQNMSPTVVDVQVVTLGDIPVMNHFSGRVAAVETSEVRPQVTGIIDEVLFREGGFVRAGQPLYRISADNYISAINADRAAIAHAEASAQNARAVYTQAQANLTAQQAMLAQAHADLARLQGLVEVDAVSRQVYDQAVTTVRTAEANVEAAQATVAQAKASINSADSTIHSAKASLGAGELDLSRTVVRAPISGKIGISAVTNGALVSANQPNALVTIKRTDYVYVDISQSSAQLLRLRQQIAEGKASQSDPKVQIVLEDGTIYPIIGRLALSDASVDEATGSVRLRALFPNPDGVLIPGMYVKANLVQSMMHDAVLLPQTAIKRTPKGEIQVYVVNQDKKIEVRQVETAGTLNGQWVINGGLKNGDQVVVLGAKVKLDQVVEIRTLPPTGVIANQVVQGTQTSKQVGRNSVVAPKDDLDVHEQSVQKESKAQ